MALSAGDMSGLMVMEEPLSEPRFERMMEASCDRWSLMRTGRGRLFDSEYLPSL